MNHPLPVPPESPPWVSTDATVTTCRYQSPALGLLAFGFQTTQRFRISFDYYAHGRLYSCEFPSPIAIAQNEHIPITYNPLHPEQNSRSGGARSGYSQSRAPILALGVAGSILLSLLWFAVLRGCN